MPTLARAETVGSLLRPQYLRQARRERLDGQITQQQLVECEDHAVHEAIRLQEAAGLDVITDGEMRRVSWIPTIPIVADRLHEAPLGGFTYRVPDQPSWFAFWRNDAGEVVQRSGLRLPAAAACAAHDFGRARPADDQERRTGGRRSAGGGSHLPSAFSQPSRASYHDLTVAYDADRRIGIA